MSHPWTASPAFVVPRWLMGVRPLEPGWGRIAIRPLPPAAHNLSAATLHTPTPRGMVSLSFTQGVVGNKSSSSSSSSSNNSSNSSVQQADVLLIRQPSLASSHDVAASFVIDFNVSVPGNTRAHVCLPLYNAPAGSTCSSQSHKLVRQGALACVEDDLVGGYDVSIRLTCVG